MTQASNLAKGGSNFNSDGDLSLTTGVTGTLPVANGGTGSTTTTGAANSILPSQTSNTGKYLTTDGTNTSWGTVTSNPGTVTSVSGTAPVSVATGTSTPVISMAAATTSVSGYLTSTDWNTFNGKLSTAVTSATASTGISVSASTGAVTFTNTGVTSIVAGTGITISGATGAVTITNSSPGGVTSLNGQTGAVVDTSLNSIGSNFVGGNLNGADTASTLGSTYAGSNFRISSSTSAITPFTVLDNSGTVTSAGLSGTWRALGKSKNGSLNCGTYNLYPNLFVRVS